jgi:hypothetical protein
MDYRVLSVVRKFFRQSSDGLPKFRSLLIDRLVEQLSLTREEADATVSSLIETEYIHPVTVWFYSSDSDSLRSRPGLALGSRVNTEVISRR